MYHLISNNRKDILKIRLTSLYQKYSKNIFSPIYHHRANYKNKNILKIHYSYQTKNSIISTTLLKIRRIRERSRRVIIVKKTKIHRRASKVISFRTRESEERKRKTGNTGSCCRAFQRTSPSEVRWNGWSASIKTKHETVGRAINSNYREPCGRRKKLSTLLIRRFGRFPSLAPQPAQSRSPSPPFSLYLYFSHSLATRTRPTAALSFPCGHENFDSPIVRHERGISFPPPLPIFEDIEFGINSSRGGGN